MGLFMDNMKMTKSEYKEYVASKAPKSTSIKDMICSFFFGGLICCAGQGILMLYEKLGMGSDTAKPAASITLIFIGAFLTALHLYDRLAKVARAGTLVPITGFANAVTASAIEFRSEGLVNGTAAKMFVIAGPVIVFGVSAASIYGVIYYLISR